MSRRSKGARLWVRERKGRGPVYVIRDGKSEISTGCGLDDLAGAEKALAEHLARTFRFNTGERDLSRITVAEVLTMYGQDQPADKPSRALIGYHIANLLPFWGDKSLADVKGSTCRNFTKLRTEGRSSSSPQTSSNNSRRSGCVSKSTARRELKTLQAAINHWHRESPLAAVPKVSLPPEGERRERVLERNEVARLLWAARKLNLPHVARFIIIGVYSGTRHNAILSLRWMPALSGGHADLERQVLYRRGSAERETSKRRPAMSIPPRLGAHLARWLRQDVADGGRSTIVNYDGSKLAKMKRAWASVVREAGLGPDVTPHVLRHSCASWLLWEGKTIWDVAGIIGADASTVERVYGHHRRIEQEERKKA
jgi:integrase